MVADLLSPIVDCIRSDWELRPLASILSAMAVAQDAFWSITSAAPRGTSSWMIRGSTMSSTQ